MWRWGVSLFLHALATYIMNIIPSCTCIALGSSTYLPLDICSTQALNEDNEWYKNHYYLFLTLVDGDSHDRRHPRGGGGYRDIICLSCSNYTLPAAAPIVQLLSIGIWPTSKVWTQWYMAFDGFFLSWGRWVWNHLCNGTYVQLSRQFVRAQKCTSVHLILPM
jgi:hypothetical protein